MAAKEEFLEDFQAGRYEAGYSYEYFVPNTIDRNWAWKDPHLNSLLESASLRLGELNAYAHLTPNVLLFTLLYVTSEAVVSSRIEGTATTFDEAFLPFEEIQPERRDDWTEVQNYIAALTDAISELKTLPISSRLLRQTHKRLMEGARGENKSPGEFRRSQNWIGGAGPSDAAFVPPAHHLVPELMSDLEKFLNNSTFGLPGLIKVGMAHYQFETIHPFLDGNGRTGRLLIALFLAAENILELPLLHVSTYFEKDRYLYYQQLTRTREENDMIGWLKYFLKGVEQAARRSRDSLTAIIELKAGLEREINESYGRRLAPAATLLNKLFEQPVFSRHDAKVWTGLSDKAANELVNLFVKDGIVREITGNPRNQIFSFERLLRIFS
ncbi:MAG: Fic family protein [Acidobacteria bacterium]|nr:Fic family protein [Acidobacteriota bacterium]